MKKLFIAALLFVGIVSFAQDINQKPTSDQREKLTPEQRNEKHLQKLTSDLNLDKKQQEQVKQLLAERSAKADKFREAKNLGIFTTRQWLDHNRPILRVVHDTDGDWQFLTGDQEPDDIRIVALEQMVLRDPSLNEVFDLDYGQAAERDSIDDAWTRLNLDDYEDI